MTNKVAEVIRGGYVESTHYGHVAVVDSGGNRKLWCGDVNRLTLSRSAIKPIQALAVITSGAADKFGFSDHHLAVMCASHYAEKQHQQAVAEILEKIGLGTDDLDCGVHDPVHRQTRYELYREGGKPCELHSNCSGKHSGMLAVATAIGAPVTGYIETDHPVQQMMFELVSELADVKCSDLAVAIDGCGVPSFGMPLHNLALMFARLADPGKLRAELRQARDRIVSAVVKHPQLIAGTNAFDTELVATGKGKLICKAGADGVHCLGVISNGYGVAVKIEDGNRRAIPPIVMAVLDKLDVFTEQEKERVLRFRKPDLKNARGQVCGNVVSTVNLQEG